LVGGLEPQSFICIGCIKTRATTARAAITQESEHLTDFIAVAVDVEALSSLGRSTAQPNQCQVVVALIIVPQMAQEVRGSDALLAAGGFKENSGNACGLGKKVGRCQHGSAIKQQSAGGKKTAITHAHNPVKADAHRGLVSTLAVMSGGANHVVFSSR
jgi:hypothetical protein